MNDNWMYKVLFLCWTCGCFND